MNDLHKRFMRMRGCELDAYALRYQTTIEKATSDEERYRAFAGLGLIIWVCNQRDDEIGTKVVPAR